MFNPDSVRVRLWSGQTDRQVSQPRQRVGKPLRLWIGGEAFGVMAPGTAQWATLEEDRGTDARAVLCRKALKVQNTSSRRRHRI